MTNSRTYPLRSQNLGVNVKPVRLTVDVENIDGSTSPEFIRPLNTILQLLADLNIRATFFVVGSFANNWQSVIKELHALGHEVGLHGSVHKPLRSFHREVFYDETAKAKFQLEQVISAEIDGFRAPYFSLTQDVPWVPATLTEAGFRYSSSVLPAWNFQAGLPGAPRQPFKWTCGLVEFPVPLFGVGKLALPALGGAYLRLVPSIVFKLALRAKNSNIYPWTYVHPYDFDTQAIRYRINSRGLVFSNLLFARRHLMESRLRQCLVDGQAPEFREVCGSVDFIQNLPEFEIV
jgi:peptidoglycan-N-acetylglucosamine deacetylase